MKFEGYQQERLLGRGATAQVYLATHLASGRKVAIKAFHPSLWNQDDSRKRAETELYTARALEHPGIVGVIESLLHMDPPSLVLDFVDGVSLEEFQKNLPYVLPEVSVWIILKILSALEHAHARGVIHRDLKPANILVGKDGGIFITDFGLARMNDFSRLTLSGTVLGSPDFMSPEQAKGEPLTCRSDLFSIASLLYFLVTGTKPFTKASPLLTLAAVISRNPEPVQQRNPKVSKSLARLIHKGLEKNPDERFQSVAEFIGALKGHLECIGLGIGLGKGLVESRAGIPGSGISGPESRFSTWMQEPSQTVLECLNEISEHLVFQGREEIKSRHWDQAFETYSHLSQVSPESSEIAAGLDAIGKSRQRETAQRRWLALGGFLALGFLLFLSGTYLFRHDKSTVPIPVTALVTPLVPAQPPHAEARSAEFSSEVKFRVPKKVRVYWDGNPVDSRTTLKNIVVGPHRVKFIKPGSLPLEKTVQVKAGEPTEIIVR